MPTFATPDPISVTVELGVGDIRIVASDRTDTVVDVRPSDATKQADVTAAEQTRVEYTDGTLMIKPPKGWRQYTLRGGGESIDVHVALPLGSHLHGTAGVAALRSDGHLGECHFKTGLGDIRVDRASAVSVKTGMGDITVDRVDEDADLSTRSGAVQVGRVNGAAAIKNSNGDTRIGEVGGDLRVSAANGRIAVDVAHGSVVAKTANGDVRLGEVAGGAVVAQTACGKIDVGIREGVAAWLDLGTDCGRVRNDLEAAGRPQAGDETVEVRARSSFGDIIVRRLAPSAGGAVEAVA